jgi:hypothetical protein
MRSTSLAMVAALTRRPELVIEPPLSTDLKLFSFFSKNKKKLMIYLFVLINEYKMKRHLFVDDIVVLTSHVSG